MSGIIIGGKAVEIPGVRTLSWKDDPSLRLKLGEDGRSRRPAPKGKAPRVSLIVLHTTGGIPGGKDLRPQSILPGAGPNTHGGRRIVDQWNHDDRCAGAHIVVDQDGETACLADLLLETTFHATTVNEISIGIEVVQGHAHAELYEFQCSVVLEVVDFLTEWFGIQRQIPHRYRRRPVPRLAAGALDFWGVCGHRDQSNNRGEGDPGNYLMDCLATRGYWRPDLEINEDIAVWKTRQAWLGIAAADCDGIPGPATTGALKTAGFRGGLWALPPAERTDLPR